jgi:cytidylate kinase
MSIITISRGTYSKGKEIAEKVAEKLNYECVSREILLEASEHFNIPEIQLERALHDAPSILERFTHGKQKYVAYIQDAFLTHMKKDNIVYHGLGGHFFLKGVSHVLKIRIIADMDDRSKLESKKANISEHKARHLLKKDDDERRRWAMMLYGVDTSDPNLYDLIIHTRKITTDEAVDIICNTVRLEHFEATDESRQALRNLVLAAHVKCKIVEKWPEVLVTADNGNVVVHLEAPVGQEKAVKKNLEPLITGIEGVEDFHLHLRPSTF